jgi:ribonuclease J
VTVSNSVRVVPLGGLGEVGMNCMSIEHGSHRVIVDCGVTFPDLPFGTDVIRPDFRHLRDDPRPHTLFWITHGHEDHIGALPYLLREQRGRVYAPPYALALIRERLAENPPRETPELVPIMPRQRYRFGPFEAEPVRVTHSIADATALALRTPAGTIVHTGDFKIDHEPTDSEHFDRERFKELGDEGVRLLLSDSTNIDSEGSSGSEASVTEVLHQLAEDSPGRVVITLFASNTHRLRAVLDIARRTHRKLCLLGRSVQTHSRVAAEVGYLERASDLIVSPQEAVHLPRHRVLIAATGSQGEPPSALARLARRAHPVLSLDPGDTVILSSRIIPGRERPVLEVLDALEKLGVHLYERHAIRGVHVSGHAQRDEQREMIKLVRPETFVPVHGTYHHLRRHAELASDLGVRETLLVQNGDVIELDREHARIVDRVHAGRVHMARGQDVADEVVADRSRLAELGVVSISFVVDERGKPLAAPDVVARGVQLGPVPSEFVHQARIAAKRALRDALDEGLLGDLESLREDVRRAMTRFFYNQLGQRVVCVVLVHRVRS